MKDQHGASDGGLVVRRTADGPRSVPRVEPRTYAQKLRAFAEVPPEDFEAVVTNARSCTDVIALSTIAGAMDPKCPNHLAYAREFADRAYGKAGPSHEQPQDEPKLSVRRAGLPSSELRDLEVLLRKCGKHEQANEVARELAQEEARDA